MNLSSIFIRRPVTTTLLMLGIMVFGTMAYRTLPVSDLPTIDFPTIQVSAGLPGASPETMAATVALPLEKQFAGIAGLSNINSVSQQGNTSITLQFDLSRNIDAAAQDVQAMIGRASRALPPQMPAPPSYQKSNPGDQSVILLVLRSATLPLSMIDEYAQQSIAQRLSMVAGVAQIDVFGSQKYAVRIDVDPRELAARAIGIDEVANAIGSANSNLPTGTIFGQKTFVVQTNAQLMRASGFAPSIIAYRNGNPVRLEEVARVYDGVENDRSGAWQRGDRCVMISIRKIPGANVVEVVDRIKALLPSIREQLPAAMALDTRNDRSATIRESVHDVKLTLLITVVLVVLVIFLFLRNVSATLIPSLALPASLVGTFMVMYLLGYSLDNMSLMALTLSVGFVVDDAIVMLENIVRHMEMGKPPMQAAYDGSKEIAFTIVSMTLSLAAVFIPVLFMGGIVGRLLHEFAVTIGVAILISGFVSLSLTPMLCSRFLKPPHATRHGVVYNAIEAVFQSWLRLYDWTLRGALRFKPVMVAVSVALLAGTIYLFMIVPTGFLPSEDQGRLMVNTEAAQGISYEDMTRHQMRVADLLIQDPNVASTNVMVGSIGNNAGTMNSGRIWVELKPRQDRKLSVDELIADLRPKVAQIPGIRAFMTNQPPINLGAGQGGQRALYQFTLQDTDTAELYRYAPLMEEKMRQLPGLEDVSSDLLLRNPQVTVDMDRNRVSALGLTANQVENALYNAYGTRQVSQIYAPNNQYQVILQVAPQFQNDPAAMSLLYVRSNTGAPDPDRLGGADEDGRRAALGQPLRSAPRRHAFIQPEAGLRARRCRQRDQGGGRHHLAIDRRDAVPGRRAGLPGFAPGPRSDSHRRDHRHLHRPRRPLRELHPSVDDSVRTAGGRLRRAVDAADLQDRVEPVRVRGDHHAGRAGEEERHHDGRLRRRGAASARKNTRGSDPRGVPGALPADHDDDDGRAGRHDADRVGLRRGRGVAAAARARGRRRTDRLAVADALHHAGLLRLHRRHAAVAGEAADLPRTPRRLRAGRGPDRHAKRRRRRRLTGSRRIHIRDLVASRFRGARAVIATMSA